MPQVILGELALSAFNELQMTNNPLTGPRLYHQATRLRKAATVEPMLGTLMEPDAVAISPDYRTPFVSHGNLGLVTLSAAPDAFTFSLTPRSD